MIRFTTTIVLLSLKTTCISSAPYSEPVISQTSTNPEAEALPSSYTVNETAVFLCQFQGLYTPEVTWYKEGWPLPDSPRFSISEKIVEDDVPLTKEESPILSRFKIIRILSLLTISNLTIEDSGDYTCVRTNSPVPINSDTIHIHLKVTEPQLDVKYVTEAESAHLWCEGIQNADSKVIWLKNGLPLPQDPRYQLTELTFENNITGDPWFEHFGINSDKYAYILTIRSAKPKDSTNYTCRIYNKETHQYHDEIFKLIVEEEEEIYRQESPGELTTLFCTFSTRFSPNIVWLKDGYPLPNDRRIKVLTQMKEIERSPIVIESPAFCLVPTIETNSLLQIYDSNESDSATYTCLVENNPTGKLRQEWKVRIKDEYIEATTPLPDYDHVNAEYPGKVSCKEDEYKCLNPPKCIPRVWKCDGNPDCDEGDDEGNCEEVTCIENQFKCPTGRCITLLWVCDMENDCDDGADEEGCQLEGTTTTDSTFVGSSSMVPSTTTEMSSTTVSASPGSCTEDEFRCVKTGGCVPMSWVCDNYTDCQDGSDESNCTFSTVNLTTKPAL